MGRTVRYNPEANEEYMKAVQALRSSGAAGTHGDRRLKRQRTRSAVRFRTINESRSDSREAQS